MSITKSLAYLAISHALTIKADKFHKVLIKRNNNTFKKVNNKPSKLNTKVKTKFNTKPVKITKAKNKSFKLPNYKHK
jgi:hypothetical protein